MGNILLLFDITHYFSSNVWFTNIVIWFTEQSGVETKYGVLTVPGQCSQDILPFVHRITRK